jgi:predicted ATPase/DNA-binding CsgD family transcriptional regulator
MYVGYATSNGRVSTPCGNGSWDVSSTQSPEDNLPRPLTRFIGREDEIELIVQLLARDEVRLVTLTGTGGIGKTRLAIEIARDFAMNQNWDVRFVTLAATTSTEEALPMIAETLGLWNSQVSTVVPRLISHLRDEHVLLVLDNLEHVIDIAGELGEVLGRTGGLKLLVTSRSPLHIQGEREYAVPQLTIPASDAQLTVEGLRRCEAVALFVDRARAINHDFDLNEQNASAIARICAQLDGLPLAIELAAARTRTLPPSTLQARLDNQLSLLRSESRDLPERLRTIRATIDWSYQLLTPEEQDVFRQISLFSGDFPLSAAVSILDTDETETLDIIESLIDKSLLRSREPFNDEPHFRMLSVVRQFGLEKLEAAEETDSARERQTAWAANFAEAMFREQFGPRQREALRQINRVHETVRQALVWSMDHEDWLTAARIASNLWQFWDLYGYLGQGRAWIGKILEHDIDWPIELIPQLYYGYGILAGTAEDARENVTFADDLLKKYEKCGDERIKATALNLLGLSRDPQLALNSSIEAAEIWERTGDTIWFGLATGLAGRWARELGDLELSDSYSRQSYEILSKVGHAWGATLALLGIGRVHQLRGEIDRADAIYRQGLAELVRLGDRILVLRFIEFMIEIAAHQKDLERAVRLDGAAERLRETMGYQLRYPAEEKGVVAFRARCRSTLGEEQFHHLWDTGYRYKFEQAINEALSIPVFPGKGDDTSRSATTPQASSDRAHLPALTRRERDVLRRIVEGKTDQAIADELYVSYRTITTHVTNILNKLSANTRTEAAAIAIRDNLIEFHS